VGFARCVTDYSVCYWLCDVIIDVKYRELGLGKELIGTIVKYEELKGCTGYLGTKDAHSLYEKYGYKIADAGRFMWRVAE